MVKLVSNKKNEEIENAISNQEERNDESEIDSIDPDDLDKVEEKSPDELDDKRSENLSEEDLSIKTLDDLFKDVDQFILSSDAAEPKDSEKEEKESAPLNDLSFDFTQKKSSPEEKAKAATLKPSEEEEDDEPKNVEKPSSDSESVISAKAKNEADFQSMNPFGKATYLLAGSLVNGVSQLLLGSAELMGQAGKKFSSNLGQVPLMGKEDSLAYADEVGTKLKEAKFNESMEGIHAIENLSSFFEDKLFNDFNAYLGKSNKLSTDEKQEMSSTFIERYGKHFPRFKEAMQEAELLICDSESKLDFFAKNLDDSEESKNKFTTYIERLESLRDRVPPWLNVGKTNVVSFLDQLLEKAKELFFSKFGVAHNHTPNPQMN